MKRTVGDLIRRLGYLQEVENSTLIAKERNKNNHLFRIDKKEDNNFVEKKIKCYKEDSDIYMAPNFGISIVKKIKRVNGSDVEVKVYNRGKYKIHF